MHIPVLILLIGLAGLLLAGIPYLLATRARGAEGGSKSAVAAIQTEVVAHSRREYAVLAGLVAAAAGLLWFALADWRGSLALCLGALCAASANGVARHAGAQVLALGSPKTPIALLGGTVVGLVQGSLLLLGLGCLYLLLAFNPAHYVDFTGFVLGAFLAKLLTRFGVGALRAARCSDPVASAASTDDPGRQAATELCLAGADWFQPLAAAVVASFALAVLLPATTTMLIGPQSQLLLLPLALVATGYLCAGVGMAMTHARVGGVQAPRFSLITTGVLILPAGFAVMVLFDVYWQLWLCLAAGTIGGLVLLLVDTRGGIPEAYLSLGIPIVLGICAWLIMPGQARAYGVSVAAVGLLAGFSLITSLEEADRSRRQAAIAWDTENPATRPAIHSTRLLLSSGWLVVLLLSFVSVQYVYTRSPQPGFEWDNPRWMLGALLGLAAVCCAAYVGLRAYALASTRLHQDPSNARVMPAALGGAALCGGLVILVTGLVGFGLGPWALCAALLGALLACVLLVPLLLDWGNAWSKIRLPVVHVDAGAAVAGVLHLLVALMACTAHLVAQVM